jgi:glycosidase
MKLSYYQNKKIELQKRFSNREQDWRMGGIVYQVFVDRFAPSVNLDQKKHLYAPPRSLQAWNTLPSAGKRDPSTQYYAHELAFWGGDLPSLIGKLDYIASLGTTTLYLNPIFEALTNHKYDTYDYETISKEYGTINDLKKLIERVHQSNMKIMLDGVFNHMALGSPIFQEAIQNPQSSYRQWFDFNSDYSKGYRLWAGVPSLPELNLKNPNVRDYLFNGSESIVKRYLRLGIDGWRLDTAIELGYNYLHELTEAAHSVKENTVVIGELLQYPDEWSPAMDGVMQLALRDLILEFVEHKISGPMMGVHLQKWVDKTHIETMLKSWILLENHDMLRIRNRLSDEARYRLAKTLQFTLPGTVNLYQGEECGMEGEGDPSNRAPMRWDLVSDHNPYLQLHRQWIQLRQQERALRIGDFEALNTERLFAFLRTTDVIEETLLIVINATDHDIEETLIIPNGTIKSHLNWLNLLNKTMTIQSNQAFLSIKMKKQSSLVLKPILAVKDGYSPYKNIL